jgi:prepilin-type N-terminal cleavage/methylation domain-containing protein
MLRLKNTRGFTLIEVMTVLAIMAIFMAITIPSYITWKPKHMLNRAVNEYHSMLQAARLKAIKDRGTCTVSFTADSYTVACPNSNYSRTVSIDEYNGIVEFVRYDGAPGVPASSLTFNSRGTSNSGYLHLTNTQRRQFYRVGPLISGVIKKDVRIGGNWENM